MNAVRLKCRDCCTGIESLAKGPARCRRSGHRCGITSSLTCNLLNDTDVKLLISEMQSYLKRYEPTSKNYQSSALSD